jgi:hypothetical protein
VGIRGGQTLIVTAGCGLATDKISALIERIRGKTREKPDGNLTGINILMT